MFDIECKQKFSTAKKTPNGMEKVFSEFYFANSIRRHFSSNFLSVSFIIIPGNPLDGKFVPTVDSDNTSFRNVVSIDCWNKFLFKTVSWNYMNETAKIKN